MPTVHREDGFTVLSYSNNRLLYHVRMFKAKGEVIVQPGSDLASPTIDRIYGDMSDRQVPKADGDMSDRQVPKAVQIAQANQAKLLEMLTVNVKRTSYGV